jgi:hypothetical protein
LALLPSVLPVFWRPLFIALQISPRASWLASWARTGAAAPDTDRALKGRSFGLAFLLAAASYVFNRAMRGDTVALVAVEKNGDLAPVGGLDLKLEIIERAAPKVSQVFIHHKQAADATRFAAGTRLTVVPIATISDALTRAFGDDVTSWLEQAASQPGDRADVLESLTTLVLSGRARLVSWSGVAAAAAAARAWPFPERDLRMLRLVEAIALRHEANKGVMEVPDADWLAQLPRDRRTRVAAQVLQQSADTGQPEPSAAEGFARQVIGPTFPPDPGALNELYVPELRAAGALARLWSVTGRAADALTMQQAIVRQLVLLDELGEVSFALSEAFRLSGALADAAAFEELKRWHRRVMVSGTVDETSRAFVDLARARSSIQFNDDFPAAKRSLADLVTGGIHVPAHVKWSAVRWMVALHRALGSSREAATARAMIDSGCTEHGASGNHARIARALCEIDRLTEDAVGNDVIALSDAADAFAHLEPAIAAHLRAATRSNDDATLARAFARLYPY